MENQIIKAAKFYHSLGWSVIPIQPNSKIPAIASWSEYQTRRPTIDEIVQWFSIGQKNIALVCGEVSGVAAIDDDSYKAQGGQIKLASTLTQVTPSGGTHFLFKCPPGLRPSVNDRLAVDIRGNGSYILVAPSVVNGKPYKWNAKIRMDFELLPVLPTEYLKQIESPQHSKSVNFSEIYGSMVGTRDINLYRAACSLLARGVTSELTYQFLLFLNNSFKEPLSLEEVKKKFESAIGFLLKERSQNGQF